ncbi:serine protease AprX [Clostridium ragsdalei P11]|uniref:Serine protease AprX n=1 Tax=Clostridium ragsdalei P11 TaxID=1353534 RepID=A0A1A6B284_9CLOT|nr:S8 family serine peptidase [Clostridium ragsdalei]OBR96397.1 serine protease AprX [Clostridium ragsdalei P11]
MFSIKKKLELNLKLSMDKGLYKTYRVIIKCNSLMEIIEKKIKLYNGKIIRSIPIINCICATLTSRSINRIIEFPQVRYVTNDCCALLCGNNSILASNGVVFEDNYKLTGKNVCIGLIDSGSYPHPDLLNPKNKITKFVDLINSYKYPYDDNGHGTFMSGIMCGSGIESKGLYKGIAENSSIYSIKAFNALGKGYVSDILFSLQLLLNESSDEKIKIICLPFELDMDNHFILSLFEKMFQIAVKLNITIIVPSGHRGNLQGSIKGIATLNNCITAAGIDTTFRDLKPYKYSSCGPINKIQKPDLSAACVNICSINSNTQYIPQRNGAKLYPKLLENPYVYYTGVSCAAAYISGVCALMYENNPELTFNDLSSLLKISCNLINVPKWCQGSGMLDLNKLLP